MWRRLRLAIGLPLLAAAAGSQLAFRPVFTDSGDSRSPLSASARTGSSIGQRERWNTDRQPANPPTNRRTSAGRVKLDGRALADGHGPFMALGATLFWAIWGEQHDAERLDKNLEWLAARGVDYVRILGMVGAEGWDDRRIDPSSATYWPAVDRLLDRLARHGLRAQVTIFADAQVMMPEPKHRMAFVDLWADRANRQPERIVLLEVANEHWKNGLEDVQEMRALGRRLTERTEVLVALSAPRWGQACDVYAGSAADLATVHYDRSFDAGNPWRPVLQPWDWPGEDNGRCRGRLPVAVNNEPIGPQSSVKEDDDPLRLVMAYVTTFLAQNAAYVLHAGAGIRGGGQGDRARGRPANFWETPRLETALAGIERIRAHLPPNLANWARHDVSSPGFPLEGLARAVEDGSVAGSYAAVSGDRFVVAVFGLRRSVTVAARGLSEIDVREPLTGTITATHRLSAGGTFELSGGDALVLTGSRR